jgi:hypothetical protein
MHKCNNCGNETTNPKFCNKSCAASFNNKRFPKRKPQNICKDCSVVITSGRTRCKPCNGIWQSGLLLNDGMTLQEAIYTNHHKTSAFSKVRSRARSVMKKMMPNGCQFCGYDKHVEVCHKKSLASFPLDTLVSEVNDPGNLLLLCPNCHWEFDHP